MQTNVVFQKIQNRIKYYLNMNYKIQASKFLFYKVAQLNDRVRGLDFYQTNTLTELGHPLDGELIHYGATRSYEMKKVLNMSGATRDDSILDFGSGKGLALVNFYRYGFKKVSGVELNKDLCNIARNNLFKLNIHGVEILNQDATLLSKELDQFNYFYFYNPFFGSVFQKVIDQIITSIERRPRTAKIIYNYPIEKEKILNTKSFKLIRRYTPFFFGGEFLIFESCLYVD